ncbi:MAG: DUF2802 domain-containing protein [Acidithiobacillus sp.]
MWWLFLLLALVVLLALLWSWRLQSRLLTELRDYRQRNNALEDLVQKFAASAPRAQVDSLSDAPPEPTTSGLPSISEDQPAVTMESPAYQRARLLAQSGRDAHFIASACQIGEEEAELLIRMHGSESRR